MPPVSRSKADLLKTLTERVRKLEGVRRTAAGELVSSGCAGLDRLLPDEGFPRAAMVEFLAGGPGSGAATLAFILARQAAGARGAVVVLDHEQFFYPLAAAALGLELEKLVVLRPAHPQDHAWALDQSLRCAGVAAVVAWPAKWSDHTYRRLQLAAKSGGTLGLLLRPEAVRSAPSWADLRLLVSALPSEVPAPAAVSMPAAAARRFRVELLRLRGGPAGGLVELELDEQTRNLSMAAERMKPIARRLGGVS